jgi:hypothetical protein
MCRSPDEPGELAKKDGMPGSQVEHMDDEAREAGGDDPNKLEREGRACPKRL